MIAASPFIFVGIIQVLIAADVVLMTGQLRFRQRRGPHSAGQTFLIAAMRHNQEDFYASSDRGSR